MLGAHGVIGAALGSDSQIISDISGVQYEYSELSCGDDDELDENDYEEQQPTAEDYARYKAMMQESSIRITPFDM